MRIKLVLAVVLLGGALGNGNELSNTERLKDILQDSLSMAKSLSDTGQRIESLIAIEQGYALLGFKDEALDLTNYIAQDMLNATSWNDVSYGQKYVTNELKRLAPQSSLTRNFSLELGARALRSMETPSGRGGIQVAIDQFKSLPGFCRILSDFVWSFQGNETLDDVLNDHLTQIENFHFFKDHEKLEKLKADYAFGVATKGESAGELKDLKEDIAYYETQVVFDKPEECYVRGSYARKKKLYLHLVKLNLDYIETQISKDPFRARGLLKDINPINPEFYGEALPARAKSLFQEIGKKMVEIDAEFLKACPNAKSLPQDNPIKDEGGNYLCPEDILETSNPDNLRARTLSELLNKCSSVQCFNTYHVTADRLMGWFYSELRFEIIDNDEANAVGKLSRSLQVLGRHDLSDKVLYLTFDKYAQILNAHQNEIGFSNPFWVDVFNFETPARLQKYWLPKTKYIPGNYFRIQYQIYIFARMASLNPTTLIKIFYDEEPPLIP
jgi:hypothetical protein